MTAYPFSVGDWLALCRTHLAYSFCLLDVVTEYCSRGSLRGILDTPNLPIPTSRSVRFALDAAKGMQFLHTRSPPRMHRDLKAANLLVSEDWTVKLADFGSARLLRNEHHDDEWVLLEHGSVFMDAGGADPIAHFRVPCDSSALNVMSAEVSLLF